MTKLTESSRSPHGLITEPSLINHAGKGREGKGRELEGKGVTTSVETSASSVTYVPMSGGKRMMPRSGVGSRCPRGQSLSVRFQWLGWTPRLVRPDLGECWEWNGHRDIIWGYGRFVAPDWTNAAHRFAYSEASGIIPGRDMHICHRCDNPPCVRPSHLFAGTRSDNMRDMVTKGRHPYDSVTKLTDAQCAEIRSRPTDAWGAKAALAREFGVSGNHISWIISGKRRAA